MATSWGQRKALGRRYSVDPALLMEAERLQQEYNLMPGREARALQAGQFNRQFDYNAQQAELNRDAQAKSGMMGTVGNLVTTGMMAKAMGGKLLGGAGSSLTASQAAGGAQLGMNTAQTAAYQEAVANGMYSPTTGGTIYSGVTPATVDAGATGAGLSSGMGGSGAVVPVGGAVEGGGTAVGSLATGEAAGTAGGGAGTTAGLGAYAGPVAIIAGALAAKKQWGGKEIPWDEKTYMQKSTTAPGSILGAGGILTNFAGADTAVGKFGKEMARGEEIVMKPIEAVFDWIGGIF